MFPKLMVPPNHPFVHRVFHYKPSILGTPIFGNINIFSFKWWLFVLFVLANSFKVKRVELIASSFDMCLFPEFVWVCVYVTCPVQHYLYRKYTDLVKWSIHQELFLGVVIPVMPRAAGFQVLMKDTFKGSLQWLRFCQLYFLCQVVLP